MSHSRLFILPSSHEGLPISLLEAMSYGLDTLVSDIPANRLAQLLPSDFFHLDMTDTHTDLARLRDALEAKTRQEPPLRNYDLTPYNWDHIAQQTLGVYASLM